MNVARRFALSFILLAPSLCVGQIEPEVDSPTGRRAFEDLASFYSGNGAPAGYKDAKASLGATDKDKAARAAEYIDALIRQMRADRDNGRAREYQHGIKHLESIEKRVAKSFIAEVSPVYGFPFANWLLQSGSADDDAAALKLAGRIDDGAFVKVANTALKDMRKRPRVIEPMLIEIQKRKLTAFEPVVIKLCNHHRARVRTVARATAVSLGASELPVELPSVDRITRQTAKALHFIEGMVLTDIPPDATWVIVKSKPSELERFGQDERFFTSGWATAGWVLERSSEQIRILDWDGRVRAFNLKDVRVEDLTLGEHVDRLLASQRQISTLLAAWCYRRGDQERAARIVFPRLDKTNEHSDFVAVPRDQLGRRYRKEMLKAFIEDRDYSTARRLARHLSGQAFDGFAYRDECRKLAGQLAVRESDFTELTLPTSEGWQENKQTLSREEQIRFLTRRLQLINGIPGSVLKDFVVAQTAKPWSSYGSIDAREADGVINPFVELRAMQLKHDELRLLLPALEDESYLLACDNYGPRFAFDLQSALPSSLHLSLIHISEPTRPY